MSNFEKNLTVLKTKSPDLYEKLKNIKNNTYEIYQTNDPANINYINKKTFKPLYDTQPIDEILKQIQEFDKYQNYPILYFFGIGNGVFYKLLINSNNKLDKIVIYEPDLEILYVTLNLLDLSNEIESDKLEIIYTKDYLFPNAMKLLEDWNFRLFLKTYDLHIHVPYYTNYKDEILKINNLNTKAIKQIIISHGNDATDSLIGIKHSLHNMPEMIQNYKFKDLLKQKNSDTAIIVSTGPSLTKQLPLLKEIQDKVTILCIDASLPILEKNNIKPDLVFVLERVELTSQFFVNTSDEFMKDIIFVIASLAHEKTLKEIKGKKVITMRPFPYNRYYGLDDFGYLGVGMSAANMAYEFAYMAGFKTAILIGQDLAYGDNVSHAKGHVLGEDEVKPKESDTYITRYGGFGKIRTSQVWLLFKNFFEKAITDAKDKIKTINSTEGGARIEAAIEMPFKDAIESLNLTTKKTIELTLPTKEEITNNFKHILTKIDEAIKYGTQKKEEIEKVFLEVAESWDQLVFLNKTNQLDKIDFKKLLKLSDKIDNIKEIFNEETFQELFLDISQSYLINYELELATIQVKNVKTEIDKQAKIIDWIMKHKEWLFMMAGGIDTQLHIMKEKKDYIQKEFEKIK